MSSDFLEQIMAGAPAPKGVEGEVRSGTRLGLLGSLSSKRLGTSYKIIGLVYPPPRMPVTKEGLLPTKVQEFQLRETNRNEASVILIASFPNNHEQSARKFAIPAPPSC